MPTEASRERDLCLQRYYQPWLDARNLVGAAPNDQDDGVNALTYKGYQSTASRDKALTAFAQLAILGLNVRRAMVSLIDSKHQYILAEATKTLSLVSDIPLDKSDQIWLGNAVLERGVAVCSHTFGSQYTATDDDGKTLTTEALVVPDMRLDDRFSDRNFVIAKPGVLFYAGVPIRTAAGHSIGVYAVSSDEPRFGLSVDELQFMMGVAATVMQHLETSKAVDDRHKGERMVRGLARFIEGADARNLVSTTAVSTPLDTNKGAYFPVEPTPKSVSSVSSAILVRQTSNAQIEETDEELRRTHKRSNSSIPQLLEKSPPSAPTQSQESEDVSQIWYRAARIIRDATTADGVIFFGTATGVQNQNQTPSLQPSPNDLSDTSDSGFSSASQATVRPRNGVRSKERSRASVDPIDSPGSQTPKLCEVIGWTVDPSGSNAALQKEHLLFSESNMERYIRRYPHGKYFSFSDSGSGISIDERSETESPLTSTSSRIYESQQKQKRKKRDRNKRPSLIPTDILRFLPGLRNLIFLPLWDTVAEKWSAGAFIWSSNPGRLMSPNHELPFLKAFGNSITSEIARLNAQTADRAKSAFIASVSHELRSPLHGILGSVEFIQDTELTPYQRSLATAVEACGKTLIDTIDHVLDYAKINKLKAPTTRRKQQMTTIISNSVLGADAEFDLSELVEEVVEAVAAGHTFRKSHSNVFFEGNARLSTDLTPLDRSTAAAAAAQQNDAVDIMLDIFPHTGWTVRTQPGAIRRIVMNLLGNALKYTPSGFVAVSLKAQPPDEDLEEATELDLTLRFTDTGKGMSLEYQRTRLFAPFSQEDPFAAGTGLGLSIVRQIVESLKGTIAVKSTKNVGTEVEVSLSLPVVKEKRAETSKIIGPVAAEMKDLKVGILSTSRGTDSSRRLTSSIRQTCDNWFAMNMYEVSSMEDSNKDLFVVIECTNPVDPLVEPFISNGRTAPVVIITHDTAREVGLKARIQQLTSSQIEVISQPCGPFKLCEVYRKVKTYMQRKPSFARASSSPSPASPGNGMRLPSISTRSISGVTNSNNVRSSGSTSPLIGNPASAMASPRPSTPVSGLDSASLAPPRVPVESPEGTPHVLLVDDNPINLHLLVMFMKTCAYPYTSATNGLEALQAYQATAKPGSLDPQSAESSSKSQIQRPITHILMDCLMPVMDGLEATRQIRKFEQAHDIKPTKVIALTGLASQQAQEEASASGVDAYLAKPVKFRDLRKVLDESNG